MHPDQLCYTPAQAARLLGKTPSTIYRFIDLGYLRAFRPPSGGRLILREEIDRYLAGDAEPNRTGEVAA